MGMLKALLLFLRSMFVPRVHLAVENLALRQQLAVCRQRYLTHGCRSAVSFGLIIVLRLPVHNSLRNDSRATGFRKC
jgi:hypothetical protein